MRFLRNVLVNSVIAAVCAVLIQAAGVPVAEWIGWSATQVTGVVERVELPGWVDLRRVEEVTEPVQVMVDQTVDWVARLGSRVE